MLRRMESWSRPLILTVLGALVLGLMAWLQGLDGRLQAARSLTENTPFGIVSLELASDGPRIEEIVSAWRSEELVATAKRSIWVDFPFLLAYSSFLALLTLFLRRKLNALATQPPPVEKGWFDKLCALHWKLLPGVALAFWLAGALDLVENLLLLRLLNGATSPAASWFATAKFALLAVGVVILALTLVLLALLRQRTFPFLQFLFYSRFPLMLGALLVLLGPICVLLAPGLLKNLFALEPRQLCWVTFLALLWSGAVLISLKNVLLYGAVRFNSSVAPPGKLISLIRQYWWLWIAILAAPIPLTALVVSEVRASHFLGILGGVAVTILFYWLAALVQDLFGDPNRTVDETLFASARRSKALVTKFRRHARTVAAKNTALGRLGGWIGHNFPGYFNHGAILSGHLQAISFMSLALALHGAGYFLLRPDHGHSSSVPALGYVIVLLIVLTWALPSISFFFDRYRVPASLILIAVPTVMNLLFATDHFFALTSETGQHGAAIVESFLKRDARAREFFTEENRERGDDSEASEAAANPPIVVVAASGGGIKASLWTATVLTGLQRDLGEPFTRSVNLLSTVSGGSVGALFYLDELAAVGHLDADSINRILQAAGRTSLHGSAWGFAYPDLLRGVAPFLVKNQRFDRGWALETIWRETMKAPEAGLGSWVPAVAEGRLPPVIFNTTQIETGEHFVLSPLRIDSWRGWGTRGHFEAYGGRDVPASTAARLSATFPWITPISRPDSQYLEGATAEASRGLQRHLADGGYYDNFGVVSTLLWLETVLQEQAESLRGRQILVLLIRVSAYDEENRSGTVGEEKLGWAYATVGPILGLAKVRSTTQFSRNKMELELLADKWQSTHGVTIDTVEFELDREGPLSWKLTDREWCHLFCGWHDDHNLQQRRQLLAQFQQLPGSWRDQPDKSWLPQRCARAGLSVEEICKAP